jgi:hypothetical protein
MGWNIILLISDLLYFEKYLHIIHPFFFYKISLNIENLLFFVCYNFVQSLNIP